MSGRRRTPPGSGRGGWADHTQASPLVGQDLGVGTDQPSREGDRPSSRVGDTGDIGCDPVPPDALARPRLDGGTQLVERSGWAVKWWPTAGEAVVYWAPAAEDDDGGSARDLSAEERERENRERAARRARGNSRRYVVANALTRMVSLTFAPTSSVGPDGCARSAGVAGHRGSFASSDGPARASQEHGNGGDGGAQGDGWCWSCGRPYGPEGVRLVMGAVGSFVRRLRAFLGVERLPYLYVVESHKDGHLHGHLLLDRFVDADALARLWGNGWVDVRRFASAGRGGREAARRAAAYASKYVGKSLGLDLEHGQHSYEVAQGFDPTVVCRRGYGSSWSAVGWVLGHRQAIVHRIDSGDCDDYSGPPWLWLSLVDAGEAVA